MAINVSIGIMRAFVEMRRFIANNALLFERISNVAVSYTHLDVYKRQRNSSVILYGSRLCHLSRA